MTRPASELARAEVLIVEDEESIRCGVCDVLVFHGHSPTGVESGEEGLALALERSFDLVILDVMLPEMNGFEVCRRLRQARPEQHIMMLTAKGSEADILEGFKNGSDDYLTKPFSVSELVARVSAQLRRARREPAPEPRPERFHFGDWEIDGARLCAEREGRSVELSRREVDIMALLLRERGRIVSRRMLLAEVWGFAGAENIQTRTVDVHIAKLRKKLGRSATQLIRTVRGEGYRHG